ncbi:hypothetical protein DEO72_LG5g2084 [Vigna unguiculata]|uniref:Uncharacterized protein n=1 Tax=Vigna unguiculata TaxID=3917 RepID=A0A4D6M1E3_VIGUN|nr:hypothetical protein DEO72_LG5g2084 [Vigna unguiculata]
MVATVDGAAGARLAQRLRKVFFCECSLNLPMSSLARHEPLFPAPMSRPRNLPGPSEPPATAPIATRSVAGLHCILNVSHSSSRMRHAKSGIQAASPAVAPPTVIEAAVAQPVRSPTRRRHRRRRFSFFSVPRVRP